MPDDIASRHAASWLRLVPAPAPSREVADLLAASGAKIGYLRNGQRVQALKPEGSARPPRERELPALVVGVENRCEPCVFSHASGPVVLGWMSISPK